MVHTVKYGRNPFLFEFLARKEPEKTDQTATTALIDTINSNREKDNTTRSRTMGYVKN